MLHPVGGERRDGAVVETHRQREDQRPLGVAQAARDEVGDLRELECVVELHRGLLVERRVPLERGRRVGDLGHGGRVLVPPTMGRPVGHDGPRGPLRVAPRLSMLVQ